MKERAGLAGGQVKPFRGDRPLEGLAEQPRQIDRQERDRIQAVEDIQRAISKLDLLIGDARRPLSRPAVILDHMKRSAAIAYRRAYLQESDGCPGPSRSPGSSAARSASTSPSSCCSPGSAIAHYQQGGAPAAVEGIVFILALFACVVAHEFGHALAARRYGIRTPDITLLPIGGLARLERMPEKPGQEIVVALAGPAVNVVIALVLILVMNARFDMQALQRLDNPALGFMVRLASVNIFLVLFNLIPAFPMDGGRVLRALLALWYSRTQATNIAARIGQALAFVFGFFGLMRQSDAASSSPSSSIWRRPRRRSRVGMQDVSRSLGVGDAHDHALRDARAAGDDRRRRRTAAAHHAARVPGRRRRRPAARHADPQRHGAGAVEDRRRTRRCSTR